MGLLKVAVSLGPFDALPAGPMGVLTAALPVVAY